MHNETYKEHEVTQKSNFGEEREPTHQRGILRLKV
jgi:hypothetical protein